MLDFGYYTIFIYDIACLKWYYLHVSKIQFLQENKRPLQSPECRKTFGTVLFYVINYST